MRQFFKSAMAIAILALSTSVYAGDTYESSEAKCKITFPGEYEAESDEEDDVTTITVTGTQGGMIYMMIVSIHEEPIAENEEEGDLMEILTLYSFASNVDAKVKAKKTFSFNAGGEKGYYAFIKPKLAGKKYMGNYYVITRDNIMYQFTALGMKKAYEERPANKFTDSFDFVD